MALCRLLCLDFQDQIGRFDEAGLPRYDRGDVQIGWQYAQQLQNDGYTHEPFYGFALDAFALWCQQQLAHWPPEDSLD